MPSSLLQYYSLLLLIYPAILVTSQSADFSVASLAATSESPVCLIGDGEQKAFFFQISEYHQAGKLIGRLPINGITSGPQTEISLRLVADTDRFTLDPTTKELFLRRPVDRENVTAGGALSTVVECRSLLPGDDFQVNATVLISVSDENDNAPRFSEQFYTVRVAEELQRGTPILAGISATDADTDYLNNQITYRIEDDSPFLDRLSFETPQSSSLSIFGRVDFEESSNFTLTISATDNGFPPLKSTAKLLVLVEDIDDLNPRFLHDSYEAVVSVNSVPGTLLLVVPAPIHAVDGDTLNATILYSLSGEWSAHFTIDALSGDVRVDSVPPDPRDTTIVLTVVARQADRAEREARATLTVSLVAAAAAAASGQRSPRFQRSDYRATVAESLPIDAPILTASAAYEEGKVLHSIRGADALKLFAIDRHSGVISLAAPLDYERRKSYQFDVEATDGVEVVSAHVLITVANVNDNAPQFDRSVFRFDTVDSAGVIGTVKATDLDDGDVITYELRSFTDLFSVDGAGVLRARRPSALENRTYELVVLARDSADRAALATIRFDASGPLPLTADAPDLLLLSLLCLALLLLVCVCFGLLYYVLRLRRKRPYLYKASAPHQQMLVDPMRLPKTLYGRTAPVSLLGTAAIGSTSTLQRRYGDSAPPRDHSSASTTPMRDGYAPNLSSPHGSDSPLQPPTGSVGRRPRQWQFDRRVSVVSNDYSPRLPTSGGIGFDGGSQFATAAPNQSVSRQAHRRSSQNFTVEF